MTTALWPQLIKNDSNYVTISDTDNLSTGLFASTGGNHESPEAGECASGPGLPPHLSHHYRDMLLVNPEVQSYFSLFCSNPVFRSTKNVAKSFGQCLIYKKKQFFCKTLKPHL